ncbi:replication protein [Proteus terrae]|uniref:Replication protein n=1 Tax=Proteus terrae subsp. cibarius TaxID=626774 RepID=A0A8I0WVW9_9GAMM|nr:replication protein [Proteus terrae]MBG2915747.1 replication protein [Proteus terrae subsp. cibarius]
MNSNVAYADFGNQRRLTEVKVNDGDDFIKTPRQVKKHMMSISNQYLTYRQYRIIDALIEKTCGWHKDFDRITNTQIAQMINLHHTHVSKEISQLVERKILVKQGNKVGINKNVNEWVLDISQTSKPLAKPANKRLAKTANAYKPNQLNTIDTYSIDNKDKIPIIPVGENIALEILDYFNQLTHSQFQSTEPILKALNTIKAKGECYTPDEIKLVMEWAVKTWKNGKDLKPQSLCRMTRFDGYLSDALKWKNRDGINPIDCPHEELIKIWNKYVPERAIDFHEWTSRRPAYKDLEAVWNGKTNKGQWREVKHMDTCFKLISQSSLFTGLQDKGWLTLDWILTPTRWSQTYEQAKREYTERKKGIV